MSHAIYTDQIPKTMWLDAAHRLVSSQGRKRAAQSLIDSALDHGINLEYMWGVIDEQRVPTQRVKQVALAVLGSGRTALMFLSSPEPLTNDPHETQVEELSAAIHAAIDGLRILSPTQVRLAQTLIEPEHSWATQACLDAGMISVGTLDYMKLPKSKLKAPAFTGFAQNTKPIDWPKGITLRPIRSLESNHPQSDLQPLTRALEGSYIDTFDCPELCGVRSMEDVIESHRATGAFDPNHWLLIFKDDQPAGCCLLTHCPVSNSLELVYLGIAPIARGLGLGRSVLSYGIARLMKNLSFDEVTCAVDRRNAPAISIYESLGFHAFDARIGFVSPIEPLDSTPS